MLLELSIRDFAIIDDIRLDLRHGLNALTGETGAGKSILIDALGAVLGHRVSSDVVRTGAKQARVDATFDLVALRDRPEVLRVVDDLGILADEDVLILSREIAATGRSQARINGTAQTASTLTRLGALIVDIHGQSDHLSLLRPRTQLDMLDQYAGILETRQAYSEGVREMRQLRRQIDEIARSGRERIQRIDLLRFQINEIGEAALEPDEEEQLTWERARLVHAERLVHDAAAAYDVLTGSDQPGAPVAGAQHSLRSATAHLGDIASVDAGMEPLAARLNDVVFLLDDITAEIRDYHDQVELDPSRLEEVEDRLDLIKGLQRKYGATNADVLAYAGAAAEELEGLTGESANVDRLREREGQQRQRLGEMADRLSTRRREAGRRLASAVEVAIGDLKMGSARIEVRIEQVNDPDGLPSGGRIVAFDDTGIDRVEFLIAPNRGEALKPLARIASGGETARLMLAFKSILSEVDATPTLVFDEVDVGVGGRSGHVVGEKLYDLSHAHQVLVITHLPQIAAYADAHYRITKGERDGRVVSHVDEIGDDERVEELAAMLDGVPVSAAARASAREMLDRASQRRTAVVALNAG
ncbi:MAG: DNA repair protein RecN [Thermomicrobiales bacterium]